MHPPSKAACMRNVSASADILGAEFELQPGKRYQVRAANVCGSVACGEWLVAGVAHQPAGEAVGKRRASWRKGSWSILANIPMQEVVAVKGTADAAALDIPAHYRFLTIRLRQAESVSEDDVRLNTQNRYLSAVNSSCQKPACIVCY